MRECPVCGSTRTKLIFSGQAPDACTKLPESYIEAVSVPMHMLEMKMCYKCQHVYNEEDIYLEYSEYPMYNGGWGRHVKKQAGLLKEFSPCEKCLDIGGGDCGFLDLITDKGYCIDPNGKSDRHTVLTNPRHGLISEINPDTIILRHTLEHFLEPRKIINQIVGEAGDDALFFIEVPNVEKTLERKWFCDFMPAHPQNFSRNSLITLLCNAGLRMRVLFVNNCGTVLTFIGVKDKGYKPTHYEIPVCPGFDFASLKKQIDDIAGEIAFWGAAGKGASFLNHLTPNTSEIYDSDIRKVGKYVPGTGQRIKGRKELKLDKVFVTTPWRANDIYKELGGIDTYTYSNDMVGRV